MSLRLPLTGSKQRELFDVAHLAEFCSPENRSKIVTYREAIAAGIRSVSSNKAIKAVHLFCMRADGEIWLIRVGCRHGVSKVWNFGKL
jgi:hypothetical protein